MRRFIIITLLYFLMIGIPACKTQKHIETERITNVDKKLSMDEHVDKNTIKYITIVEYRDKKDSTTGEYPIEKITNITETNQDKITTKTKEDTEVKEKESSVEDTKPVNNWKWYVICYLGGIITIIIVLVIIKIIKWYIKKK